MIKIFNTCQFMMLKWQFLVQPVLKILSKWWYFHFSENALQFVICNEASKLGLYNGTLYTVKLVKTAVIFGSVR